MQTITSALKASLPIALGVIVAGLVLNYAGNLPVISQAKKGFTA